MLSDFENKSMVNTLDFQSVKNWGKILFELHIDDGTDNLRDLAGFSDRSSGGLRFSFTSSSGLGGFSKG